MTVLPLTVPVLDVYDRVRLLDPADRLYQEQQRLGGTVLDPQRVDPIWNVGAAPDDDMVIVLWDSGLLRWEYPEHLVLAGGSR